MEEWPHQGEIVPIDRGLICQIATFVAAVRTAIGLCSTSARDTRAATTQEAAGDSLPLRVITARPFAAADDRDYNPSP